MGADRRTRAGAFINVYPSLNAHLSMVSLCNSFIRRLRIARFPVGIFQPTSQLQVNGLCN